MLKIFGLLFLFLINRFRCEKTCNDSAIHLNKCEPITVPMCQEMGYNYTQFPNHLKHDTQNEAGMQVSQFMPVVNLGCSDKLQGFLCSLYVPPCLPEMYGTLKLCRELCDQAQAGCEQVLMELGFDWPEVFKCEQFSSCS
ncbi:frizzled-5-like [Convolutriloba macropyga]|uniref:frizzled-5-like n=1 Tax=Convolutriloba macropyga TaxID=536237 RepID=UPI003F521F52